MSIKIIAAWLAKCLLNSPLKLVNSAISGEYGFQYVGEGLVPSRR